MRRHHQAVWGVLLAIAGAGALPAQAQDQVLPASQEAIAAETATPSADVQAPLQAVPAPARTRLSMTEKAAAVTGAVAAGVVAFKGLSGLFKSNKKQTVPAVAPAATE